MEPTITISVEAMKEIATDIFAAGMAQAVKMYEPIADWVKKDEITVWCVLNDINPKSVMALIKDGTIRGKHSGRGINTPVVYSKADIRKQIAIIKMMQRAI